MLFFNFICFYSKNTTLKKILDTYLCTYDNTNTIIHKLNLAVLLHFSLNNFHSSNLYKKIYK